jgi:TatD DNase family protein
MQLVDTHVHINFERFQSDLEAVRQRWQEAGVVRLVHSCVTPEEFDSIQALANQFEELSFAVGLHPLEAHQWHGDTARQIETLARRDPRVVAIGEMGLDFYKAANQQQQKEVFEAQLKIARELDKPVIIHCREAAAELAELLRQFTKERGSIAGVMHCWSGTPEETQWFLDLGFYISFSGIVTFKKADDIQESARLVPGDRLLVETDCPFLAPVPRRGKRNEPAFVRYVAEAIAQLRGVDLDELARQTTQNAARLFRLSLPDGESTPVPAATP